MDGLSLEDYKCLNYLTTRPLEERRAQYERCRGLYKDDPLALEEIDAFDGESPYHERMRGALEAIRAGDEESIEIEREWFKEHYPLMWEQDKELDYEILSEVQVSESSLYQIIIDSLQTFFTKYILHKAP